MKDDVLREVNDRQVDQVKQVSQQVGDEQVLVDRNPIAAKLSARYDTITITDGPIRPKLNMIR